jgi:hypothetical protein
MRIVVHISEQSRAEFAQLPLFLKRGPSARLEVRRV